MMIPEINLYVAWGGVFAGFLAGMIQGMFFHDENWLGGYGSWRRRMTRLGHISFFGIAIVNFAYFFSIKTGAMPDPGQWPSILLVVGHVTMPLVCYLSAFRKPVRHFFAVPVVSLLLALVIFFVKGMSE